MNTRFSYLYRDGCNYKKFNEIVVEGVLAEEQLIHFLREETFFIPSQVGLLDLQPEEWTVDDHIWHEIEHLQMTLETPGIRLKAEQLLIKFELAHENGWDEFTTTNTKYVL